MKPAAQRGLSLVELLMATTIASLLLVGLMGVAGQSVQFSRSQSERVGLELQAQQALQRLELMLRASRQLLVPLAENPATAHSESSRNVLAVALGPGIDANRDGFADADNDMDGRVNEDPPADLDRLMFQAEPGVPGVDDDGDGSIDEGSNTSDDDEDGVVDEDPVNGADDDNDGSVDEDPGADRNNDKQPGTAFKDDNVDGSIDNSSSDDDDEDGSVDEDRVDPVIYSVTSGQLYEKILINAFSLPYLLADHVTDFKVVRLTANPAGRGTLLSVTLTLTGDAGTVVTASSQIRVGDG